jgi:hypothetical protein
MTGTLAASLETAQNMLTDFYLSSETLKTPCSCQNKSISVKSYLLFINKS